MSVVIWSKEMLGFFCWKCNLKQSRDSKIPKFSKPIQLWWAGLKEGRMRKGEDGVEGEGRWGREWGRNKEWGREEGEGGWEKRGGWRGKFLFFNGRVFKTKSLHKTAHG